MTVILSPPDLYKLPWTDIDNAMSWLEPTRKCNLHCDACFHINDSQSEKSLTEIAADLDQLLSLRRCDAICVAGGEPMTHPQLADIMRLVSRKKVKPILFTNGIGLDRDNLKEMKAAGLFGVNLHIDSHQLRPGWENATEIELNELRQQFADLVYDAGNLSCAYNVTVFPDTLKDVPEIVAWAAANIQRVHALSLIPVRMLHRNDPHDYYVGERKVPLSETPYESAERYRQLSAQDVLTEIVKVLPDYRFNSFLGGTVTPQSAKWVVGSHIGNGQRSYGSVGPVSMRLLQSIKHLFSGSYLAYSHPRLNRQGRSMLLLGVIDKSLRTAFKRYLLDLLRLPFKILKPLYVQSITAVQPLDIYANGDMNFCAGCPNMTPWKDKLVNACRLEEYLLYGAPIRAVPKKRAQG